MPAMGDTMELMAQQEKTVFQVPLVEAGRMASQALLEGMVE